MTDDLRDRIARALFIEGVGPEAAGAWDAPGDGGRQRWWNYADAVIAELGPLIEEQDRLRHQAEAAEAEVERLRIQWDRSGKNDLIEQRDTYRDRWRQLMRDYEAVFEERDELEAECLRVDEVNSRLGERVRQQDEVIERVRALLREGGPWCWSELADAFAVTLDDLRAALEGDGR